MNEFESRYRRSIQRTLETKTRTALVHRMFKTWSRVLIMHDIFLITQKFFFSERLVVIG